MNYESDKTEIANRVSSDLRMHLSEQLSDKEMIMQISDRVERLLRADPDLMMSYLYRLDVTQESIKAAIESNPLPVHVTFATLIWERQKQRIETKRKYKQDPIEGWEF